ncbi:MAG: iron ABC transporter permease [Planctomycetes bacterium]|jgi:iron complex transport system permease protein|nr:iron ABC transporter permease [Planctomycetota bacterium]
MKSERALPPLLAVALVVTGALYLGLCREGPGFGELLQWIGCWFGASPPAADVAFVFADIRLPRLLVAAFGGAALAAAGAVMQATFRNPLASPDLVGTAAGAAFGGALAIVLDLAALSLLVVPLSSLAGASAVTALVFVLARAHGRFAISTLLLAGIALNTLVGALTSFVVTFTFDNYTASSRVLFWLMGGLEARTWEHAGITAVGFVLFTALLAGRVRELDLLTLHDDSAHSLGVDAPRARRWLVWCACGLTATTVANTGGIALLGLVVPHLARLLVGPLHARLLPTSALLGALLLVGSDLACRLAPPDANLRLGVVTTLLGAPYFLFLLARHRRGEEA